MCGLDDNDNEKAFIIHCHAFNKLLLKGPDYMGRVDDIRGWSAHQVIFNSRNVLTERGCITSREGVFFMRFLVSIYLYKYRGRRS